MGIQVHCRSQHFRNVTKNYQNFCQKSQIVKGQIVTKRASNILEKWRIGKLSKYKMYLKTNKNTHKNVAKDYPKMIFYWFWTRIGKKWETLSQISIQNDKKNIFLFLVLIYLFSIEETFRNVKKVQGGNSLSDLRRLIIPSIVCEWWSSTKNQHQLTRYLRYNLWIPNKWSFFHIHQEPWYPL